MALAAFAVRSGEETRQMQVVCLDDLVPADDDLRRIEALVDWGQVRRTAEPFYRPGGAGRPGLDPAVLVKLALVLAWRGMGSMRETLRVARTDVSIRRFLGFGLTERLVVDGTHSEADAALRSLRAELAPTDGDVGDGDGELVPEAAVDTRPVLA